MIGSITNPLVAFIIYLHEILDTLTLEFLLDLILNAPIYYEKWWRRLLIEAPLHILIETFLISFIIWLWIWHRTEDPRKSRQSVLTEVEKYELISTWTPEPLVPNLTALQHGISDNRVVCSHLNSSNTSICTFFDFNVLI